jgi:hypothetical protein
MPPVPREATAPYGASSHKHQKPSPPLTAQPTTPHHRHGDRDSGDEDAAKLPVYCRYRDLIEAGIATNWPQLLRMIDGEGFPTGIMLSANIRVWEVGEIRQWLATRPTAKKVVHGRKQQHDEVEKAST